jgi:glycosyltransferase involved in cell wall biosynthesis
MRIHLVAPPHTQTTRAYEWCAFTGKTRKLATMLHSLGNEVILYGGPENEADCTEHVPVFDAMWQKLLFGHYDWSRDLFNDFQGKWWTDANKKVATAVLERARAGDLLGITLGTSQRPIGATVEFERPGLVTPVEVGVGYSGVWAPYRIYDSYAWAHYLSGRFNKETDDFRPNDAVIPNAFEVELFPLGEGSPSRRGRGFGFIGRFIKRKGVEIAVETCRRIGAPLIMAGQGVYESSDAALTGLDVKLDITPSGGFKAQHIGTVNTQQRARLLGVLDALFVPTLYLEPFGMVAVEAMLCGTPVITTDHGAFTEFVVHGVNGFRCRTADEFAEAAEQAHTLDRVAIRQMALARFSMEVVKHRYDAYLRKIAGL